MRRVLSAGLVVAAAAFAADAGAFCGFYVSGAGAQLTNNATQTLPVLMGAFNAGDSGMDWGGLTASGMLVILPVIVFSFAAQRHLVAGLSSGAVKG